MQRPSWKFELNIGTMLPVFILLGSWIWFFSGQSSQITTLARDFNTYQMDHAELHKEAKSGNSTQFADLNARMAVQERMNAEYRLSALEARAASADQNVSELKRDMGELRTEQRLTNQQLSQIIEFLRGGTIPPRQGATP